MSEKAEKAAFMRAAEAMDEELRAWREAHPEATFDEIAAQVTPKRRALMGELLGPLVAYFCHNRMPTSSFAKPAIPSAQTPSSRFARSWPKPASTKPACAGLDAGPKPCWRCALFSPATAGVSPHLPSLSLDSQ